jgi:hypothetical protein
MAARASAANRRDGHVDTPAGSVKVSSTGVVYVQVAVLAEVVSTPKVPHGPPLAPAPPADHAAAAVASMVNPASIVSLRRSGPSPIDLDTPLTLSMPARR